MLAKLIKYNLKPIFKSLLPFIVLLFTSIIIFNVSDYNPDYAFNDNHDVISILEPHPIQQFIHGFADFAIIGSFILLFAVAIRSIWRRFQHNFYSGAAYLTHTLPVPRHTLWNVHCLSALITFLAAIFVIILGALLLILTHGGQQRLESFGLIGGCSHCVGDYYYIEPLPIGFYLSYGLAFLAELIFITFCGFFGIIIGQRLRSKPSLLAGLGVFLIGNLLLLAFYLFISSINPQLVTIIGTFPTMLTPGQTYDYSSMSHLLLCASLIYICYNVILYFINRQLLDRGINLD